MTKRCPKCKQPLQPIIVKARICSGCKLPMGLHDKYTYVRIRGVTALRHRDCKNPTKYFPDLSIV